ncbi:MAG: methylenetetrahydrofolate reductase C-terminal domain-containing protein [Thermoleophilia bacterium]
MIAAEKKPFEQIKAVTDQFEKVLVVGCNTCVAVCLTGGEKEAELLTAQLRLQREKDSIKGSVETVTVLRQCENEYVDAIAAQIDGSDLVLSMACSIGPQLIAERFPKVRVAPAMNTNMLAVVKKHHVWSEYCVACGDCGIFNTGGICPIARCAKQLLNGPCGGSQGGHCEISAEVPCVWQLIYDKLATFGLEGNLGRIGGPKNWSKSNSGGPRTMKKEGFEP